MPRPRKLTETTVKTIETALEQGYCVRLACYIGGVSTSTFHAWKARGRRESERLERSQRTRPKASEAPFLDCFVRFSRAAVMPELVMLYTMNRLAIGGYPVSTTHTRECLTLPDGSIFDAVTTTTHYAPPNGRAAIWILERRWPEKWGRRRRRTPDPLEPAVGMTLAEWKRIKGSAALPEGNHQA